MRIGIDARLYGVASGTGIGRYTEELVHALGAMPIETADLEFVVFLRRDAFATFAPPNTRWSKVLAEFRPYTLTAQTQFPRVLADARVDLMHFTHFDHPLAYRGPFLTTIHDTILLDHPTTRASTLGPIKFWTKYLAYRSVIRDAVRRSMRVLTPSRAVKDDLVRRFRVLPEQVIAAHLGVNHAAPPPPSAQQNRTAADAPPLPNRPFVLYVGNAYPHKNLAWLVRVWPNIAEAEDGLLLVLVGREDDFYHTLRTHVDTRTPIVFMGPCGDEALQWLYQHATAYVSPSLAEGFDLPTLEAAAKGIPVVATKIPVHTEILGDGAHFFPPGDGEALHHAIRELRTHHELRDILIRHGRARAQQYSWSSCATETLRAYREALALRFPS
ncbi:glycosyltransferase family 4 protein [Candidatus Uhrbacteria bacterium]|nr:glycosyltransferase family 4 protein [Candidatus Uhrbacteria bacterium]